MTDAYIYPTTLQDAIANRDAHAYVAIKHMAGTAVMSGYYDPTPEQDRVYDYIKTYHVVSLDAIARDCNLSMPEVEDAVAFLVRYTFIERPYTIDGQAYVCMVD